MTEEISPRRADRNRRILRNVTLVGIGLSGLYLSQRLCLPTAVFDGIWVWDSTCPSGDLRQSVALEYEELQREEFGVVKLRVRAHYTTGDATQALSTFVRLFKTELMLVYPDGKERALEVDKWNLYAGVQAGNVRLPRVPDGDYKLRAKVRSAIEEQVVDVPLPLYAPARVHVITDRPLYEPGNSLQFRAVVLSAYDMDPLAERPGKWLVTSPDGTTLLEEATQTDEWGVVSGSFPLDRLAESGQWTVQYLTGADSGQRAVTVEPFTLPRFRVEAKASQPHYAPGDTPKVTGRVVYSSGAPVASAAVEIDWQVVGGWPPPTAWGEGALPTVAQTDRDGNFTLRLPAIPGDLQGKNQLVGRIAAVDAAGDRVASAVSLLLAEDPISAEVVTELGGGLAEGFNNRTYVRVTSPAGVPLPGAAVTVRRAWDATDEGQEAIADADGVAALQLDPGAPVTVVIPPPPLRPPPRPQPVRRTGARDLLNNAEATLAERLALDPWIGALEPCARWVQGGAQSVTLGLSVAPSGQIESVFTGESPLEQCAAQAVAGRRLPAGPQRLMRIDHRIDDPGLPTIDVSLTGTRSVEPQLRTVLQRAALDARACLPEDAPDTVLPRALLWETTDEQRRARLRWARDGRNSTRLSGGVVACVERTLTQGGATLADEASMTEAGVARITIREAERLKQRRPQPTVMMGYELAVSARMDDAEVGETLVRIEPATLPPLRIRANPVIAQPGEAVTFEFIRGPGFYGELPEELTLMPPEGEGLESKLDPKTRQVSFTLPGEDAEGWYTLEWDGARARVFVPEQDSLSLALSTDRERYAPGDRVTINVEASAQASVGLIGVDQSLGQLAPLPGPADMAEALIPAPDVGEAFAGIDGQALVMGRVRGDNAAAATVLRVSAVPELAARDRAVSGDTQTGFDPLGPLTDSFYTVLAELHVQTRAWEDAAKEGELMTPAAMAGLWEDAVDAVAEREEPHTDAYGRPLRLTWLPNDLLSLTAPHEVVLDSTHLPEDVENWTAWVRTELR